VGHPKGAKRALPTSIFLDWVLRKGRRDVRVAVDVQRSPVTALGAGFGIASERGVPLTWVGRVRNLQTVLEAVESVALQSTEEQDRRASNKCECQNRNQIFDCDSYGFVREKKHSLHTEEHDG
jgi:hypothetical protein